MKKLTEKHKRILREVLESLDYNQEVPMYCYLAIILFARFAYDDNLIGN